MSLFSVANCLGRMSTALLPERLANGHVMPRTYFLTLGCLATALTSVMDAVSTVDMLPYTSLCTGSFPRPTPVMRSRCLQSMNVFLMVKW